MLRGVCCVLCVACLLRDICCSVFVRCLPLLFCRLYVAWWLCVAVRCTLCVVCCMSCVMRCVLCFVVVFCVLSVVCGLLADNCYVLCDVRRVLYVVRCGVCGV